MNTLRYLRGRLLSTIPMLVLVGLITFLLIHITPGDPASVVAGDNASPEAIEAARVRLGLDKPFLVQFWNWLTAVLRGDLGTSFTSGKPVTELILERLPTTLSLTAGAILVGLLISVPLGVFAATRRGSWLDRLTIVGTSLGIAAPEFFIGLLLVLVVSLEWGWLPATGYIPFNEDPVEYFRRLTLPCIERENNVEKQHLNHDRTECCRRFDIFLFLFALQFCVYLFDALADKKQAADDQHKVFEGNAMTLHL